MVPAIKYNLFKNIKFAGSTSLSGYKARYSLVGRHQLHPVRWLWMTASRCVRQVERERDDSGAELAQLRTELAQLRTELAQLREENGKAQAESERLLHLMQMSQEEQFAKDKTIRELQE